MLAGSLSSPRRFVQAAGPTLLAALGAVIIALAGWHGKDFAASTYRVEEFRHHGVVLWDTAWFGGSYPLSYSVLVAPIGALLGLRLTGVVAAAVCVGCFDYLVCRWWGRRPLGVWLFALSTLLEVGIGQFPFLTGEAFALGALVLITQRRRGLAVAAGILAALCSGVAVVFLTIAALGWAYSDRDRRRGLVALAIVPLIVLGAVNLAFPGTGTFPYPAGGFELSLAVCAAALFPPFRAAPAVRAGAVLYAVLVIGAFVIPSPMGGNASRLAQAVGIPLIACFALSPLPSDRLPQAPSTRSWLPRWGWPLVAAFLVGMILWQWSPGVNVVEPVSRGPATTAAFYRPLIGAVAARASTPVRLEVVPTEQHWESVYVAPHDALARGWERQIDIADNHIFYRSGALNPSSYHQWLLSQGVTFVALANAPLDYAGTDEGRLLRGSPQPWLTLVWQSPQWQLWRVDDTPGLITGPGQVTYLGPDMVTVATTSPGTFTLRVRWTRYWAVTSGDACIAPGPRGWTTIHNRDRDIVRLGTTFNPLGGGGHC